MSKQLNLGASGMPGIGMGVNGTVLSSNHDANSSGLSKGSIA